MRMFGSTDARPARTIFGAAALMLLAGLLFAPLCSALSACTGPCCHPALEQRAAVESGPICPVSRCVLTSPREEVAAIAPATPPDLTGIGTHAMIVATEIIPTPPVQPRRTESSTPAVRGDRALNVLHSVFLI